MLKSYTCDEPRCAARAPAAARPSASSSSPSASAWWRAAAPAINAIHRGSSNSSIGGPSSAQLSSSGACASRRARACACGLRARRAHGVAVSRRAWRAAPAKRPRSLLRAVRVPADARGARGRRRPALRSPGWARARHRRRSCWRAALPQTRSAPRRARARARTRRRGRGRRAWQAARRAGLAPRAPRSGGPHRRRMRALRALARRTARRARRAAPMRAPSGRAEWSGGGRSATREYAAVECA